MNQEELEQKIAEYYLKLPEKAQVAFASQKWLEVLRNISTRHSLTESQVQTLATETTLVLLSIISRSDYEEILKKELELPKDKLENILEEISSLVINPIINELSETFNKNIGIVEEKEVKPETLEQKIEKENLVKEEVDPRFLNLQPKVRQVIEESNYQAKIFVLAKEKGLTIAQTTELESIVTDTILGVVPSSMFESKVLSIPGVEANKLKELINEVNDKILKDMRSRVLALENKPQKEVSLAEAPIEIAPTPEVTTPEVKTPTPQEQTQTKQTPSIAFQKLSGSFKNSGVTTEYSLNNSKHTDVSVLDKPSTTPKVDPYRMPIE